jgi:hypothetical protein
MSVNALTRIRTVLLMGAAACLLINGCFSCSYKSQQTNPYPSSTGATSSTTTTTTCPVGTQLQSDGMCR